MPQKASFRATTKVSLAVSSLDTRYAALEKEHQWLLKQIKRKQTELKNFVLQMRSVATEIFGRANSSFNQVVALDAEIHALFDEILTARKLGKQTRKNIVGIYQNLQAIGILSPKAVREEKESELEDWLEMNEQENNFYHSSSQSYEPERKVQQKLEFDS